MLSNLNILTILFVSYRLTRLKRKKMTEFVYLPMIFELVYITETCVAAQTSVVLKNNYIIYKLWIFKGICLPFLKIFISWRLITL